MKHDKFKQLAEARTRKAMKQIQLIGNLSNKSSYEYNVDEINAIFGALDAEMGRARSRFENTSHVDRLSDFNLG